MKSLRFVRQCGLAFTLLLAGCLLATSAIAEGSTTRPARGGQRNLEEVFKKIDANGDGKISREEFSAFVKKVEERRAEKAGTGNKSSHDGSKLFDRLDTNKDGFLSFDEFKKIAELRHAGQKGAGA